MINRKSRFFRKVITLRASQHFHVIRNSAGINPADQHLFSHEYIRSIVRSSISLVTDPYYISDVLFTNILTPEIKHSYPYGFAARSFLRALLLLLWNTITCNVVKLNGRYISPTDNWTHGYYHWLVEVLPRTLVLSREGSTSSVIVTNNFKDFPYIKDSLTAIGMTVRYLSNDKVYRPSEVVYGGKSSMTGNPLPDEVNLVRSRLHQYLDDAAPSPSLQSSFTHIWISRSKAPRRRLANEQALFPRLGQYGFTVVHLEDYTFSEQIYIFRQALVVVGLHGAGLANMIAMEKGSLLCEIRIFDDDKNNCYFSLASALAIRYTYAFASPTPNGCILTDETLISLLNKLNEEA